MATVLFVEQLYTPILMCVHYNEVYLCLGLHRKVGSNRGFVKRQHFALVLENYGFSVQIDRVLVRPAGFVSLGTTVND